MDGGTIFIADDDWFEIDGVGDLIVGENVGACHPVGDLTFSEVGILQTQDGLDVRHREPIAGKFCGVYFHTHGWQGAAADVDLAYTLNLRKFLLDDGGSFVVHSVRTVFAGGEADDHDGRIGGIYFAIGGIRGQIGGEVGARGIDGGFDVASGAVDVAAEIELNGYGSGAEAASRSHLRDAGDVAELAFERSGDGGSHDFGAGSGKAGVYRDGGEVHLGERRDGQNFESDGAGDGDGHG